MDTWSNTFDEWIKAAQAIYDIQRVNLLNPDRREINVRPGDEHYADFGNWNTAWKELETLISTFMGTMSVTEENLTERQKKPIPMAEEFMEFVSTEEMLNCKKKLNLKPS